ncbi:hypothetical protein [Paraburkholderia youngii]|uniref:hypothetical protein n=1 Tax=Paraburkholderia youngii TaxID=2782701 RepID=UPI003D1F2ECE
MTTREKQRRRAGRFDKAGGVTLMIFAAVYTGAAVKLFTGGRTGFAVLCWILAIVFCSIGRFVFDRGQVTIKQADRLRNYLASQRGATGQAALAARWWSPSRLFRKV